MDAPAPVCRNCGAALEDRYCHRCGQDARELPQALVPLAGRMLAGALDLDSRPVSTFLTLFLRPGRLTAAYVAGRRVRYAQPVQVYLWCTALFFLVHAYTPVLRLDAATGRVTGHLSAVSFDERLPQVLVDRVGIDPAPMPVVAARFDAAVSAYLPILLVGIVAASAVMFELLYRRQRALTHIVFALHWAAVYFTLEAARQLLPIPAAWDERSGMVLGAIVTAHLAVAMRVVYGAGWTGAIAKALVVFVVFSVLLSVWLSSAVSLAARFA